MRSAWWVVTGVAVALLAACGTDSESKFDGPPGDQPETGTPPPDTFGEGGGGGGGGGDAASDGGVKPCTTSADCGAGGFCNPSSKTCGCGGTAIASDVVPPNMLVVLDRSCSMTDKVGAVTKWEIAVAALKDLLTKNKGKIRFGLEMFPDITGNSCTQDAFAYPVAPGNETAIDTLLTSALAKADPYFPDGPCVTNIDTAVQAAKAEPAFTDTTRKSFVVLITDGQQAGCNAGGGDNGTTQFVKDLKAAGVDTFVIGFGSGVDVAQMDIWATEGGQPKGAASPKFYDASDKASLDLALSSIAKKTLGCSLKLAAPPPGGDVGLINVFLGTSTTPLARDPSRVGRWDYDPTTQSVVFAGAECTALKDGTAQSVNVVFGCPGGPPPENPGVK